MQSQINAKNFCLTLTFSLILALSASAAFASDKAIKPKIISTSTNVTAAAPSIHESNVTHMHGNDFSLADVINPLLPSVVNIQTIKHSESGASGIWQKLFSSEKVSSFAKTYKLPFSGEEKEHDDSNINSIGSGFIIDENGYIVTNYHVIETADEIFVKLADDSEHSAHLVGSDPKTDLALLKIEAELPMPYVIFGDSDELRVGDTVIAIGNPLGLGGSVTSGIISFKGRELGTGKDNLIDNFLQTDASINIGNSGGPLFNIHGEVIGLNSSIPKIGNGLNVGIGFAVPSNTVKTIVLELKDKGQINRGRIGITVQLITNELAEALDTKATEGLVIVAVAEDGPGAAAGLKRGDIISKFNNQKVTTTRKLELLVAENNIDDEIEIEVIRGKEVVNTKIKITGPNDSDNSSINSDITRGGITFTNISSKNTKVYGLIAQNGGIVITKIEDDSKTELKLGDIVTSLNDQQISDVLQFQNILDKLKKEGKTKTAILIRRGDAEILVPMGL